MTSRKFKIAILFLTALFCANCSTIRMNYQADVDVNDGRHATYKLAKSYEIGGSYSTLCAVTGIFLGGACWYYFVMPTVNQEKKIASDGEARLKKAMAGKEYKIASSKVDRESWSEGDEDSRVIFHSKDDVPASHQDVETKVETKPEAPSKTENK